MKKLVLNELGFTWFALNLRVKLLKIEMISLQLHKREKTYKMKLLSEEMSHFDTFF